MKPQQNLNSCVEMLVCTLAGLLPAHKTFPARSRESPQASCTHSAAVATSSPGIFLFLPHFLFPRPPLAAAARAWLQLCSSAAHLLPGKCTAMPLPSCSHSCSREKGNFDPPTTTLGIPSLVCIPRSSVSPELSAPV